MAKHWKALLLPSTSIALIRDLSSEILLSSDAFTTYRYFGIMLYIQETVINSQDSIHLISPGPLLSSEV